MNRYSESMEKVRDYIYDLCRNDMFINIEEALFGVTLENKPLESFVNFIIIETKWQIWKNRNNVKYGKKDTMSITEIFELIRKNCLKRAKLVIKKEEKKKKTKHRDEIIGMFELLI